MRIVSLSISLLLSGSLSVGPAADAQQSGGATCMPPDQFANLMVLHYRHLATSTDTSVAPTREIMKLPIVLAAAVSYVTDNSICAKAEAAYSAAADSGRAPLQGASTCSRSGTTTSFRTRPVALASLIVA